MTTPDPSLLDAVHRRLVDGDPTAPADLAELVFYPLRDRLCTIFRRASDPDVINDAVVDAVFGYAERPSQFDPTRGSLFSYLMMSARGDFLNAIRARERRRQHERPLDDVEVPASRRKVSISREFSSRVEDDVVSRVSGKRLAAQVRAAVETAQDAAALQLMIDGERSTARFAAVLGIEKLSLEDQRRAVKRQKDRLKKRLERLQLERDD